VRTWWSLRKTCGSADRRALYALRCSSLYAVVRVPCLHSLSATTTGPACVQHRRVTRVVLAGGAGSMATLPIPAATLTTASTLTTCAQVVLAGGARAGQRGAVLAALDAWPAACDSFLVLLQVAGRPLCFRGLYAVPVRV